MREFILANIGSSAFWSSGITVSTPLALAALGCLLCSRAGVLFVAVDGVMLTGGFFALAGVAWTGSVALGVVLGAVGGAGAALVFGVLSMVMRMGDIVGGLVVHVGALGVTGFLVAQLFPNGLTVGSSQLQPLWGPVGGPTAGIFLHQEPLVYATVLFAFAIRRFLRSRWGLRVRASGESMAVAESFGVPLMRLRFVVLAVGGALTGLGGAALGIGLAGTFNTQLVGGRGFVGLVCVILGAWAPVWAAGATVLFGFAYVLQFQFPGAAGNWAQTVPYVLTLVALTVAWGRASGPADEGRGLPERIGRARRATSATESAVPNGPLTDGGDGAAPGHAPLHRRAL